LVKIARGAGFFYTIYQNLSSNKAAVISGFFLGKPSNALVLNQPTNGEFDTSVLHRLGISPQSPALKGPMGSRCGGSIYGGKMLEIRETYLKNVVKMGIFIEIPGKM